MSEVWMMLALPCLLLAGIGGCLRPLGLHGLAGLGGSLFVVCLALSLCWQPLSLLVLSVMSWLGRVILAGISLVCFVWLLRWISRRI